MLLFNLFVQPPEPGHGRASAPVVVIPPLPIPIPVIPQWIAAAASAVAMIAISIPKVGGALHEHPPPPLPPGHPQFLPQGLTHDNLHCKHGHHGGWDVAVIIV